MFLVACNRMPIPIDEVEASVCLGRETRYRGTGKALSKLMAYLAPAILRAPGGKAFPSGARGKANFLTYRCHCEQNPNGSEAPGYETQLNIEWCSGSLLTQFPAPVSMQIPPQSRS